MTGYKEWDEMSEVAREVVNYRDTRESKNNHFYLAHSAVNQYNFCEEFQLMASYNVLLTNFSHFGEILLSQNNQ